MHTRLLRWDQGREASYPTRYME